MDNEARTLARRLDAGDSSAAAPLLRLFRRSLDVIAIVAGVDPTVLTAAETVRQASNIASEIDLAELAQEIIDIGDVADSVAGNIDMSDFVSNIDMQLLVEHLDLEEIAERVAEKVAEKVAEN